MAIQEGKDWLSSEIAKNLQASEEIREQNKKRREEFNREFDEQKRRIEKRNESPYCRFYEGD